MVDRLVQHPAWLVAAAAAAIFGVTVWLVWMALEPHRGERAAARRLDRVCARQAHRLVNSARRPGGTPRRRTPMPDNTPAPDTPADVLGEQRCHALLLALREAAEADPRTRAFMFAGPDLTWLTRLDSPPPALAGAFSQAGYALTVGHLLAAGWELGVPDPVLVDIVGHLMRWRMVLAEDATPATAPAADDDPRTMYEQVGVDGVRVLVDRFYSGLCGDEITGRFFGGVDMGRLRRHQTMMISQILGGPATFYDGQLTRTHSVILDKGGAPMVIDNRVYARTAGYLLTAAWSLALPGNIVVHVLGALASKRTLITEASRQGAARAVRQAGRPGSTLGERGGLP